MESFLRKYALQNAVKFGGKANPGSALGKLLKEHPDARKDTKKWTTAAATITTAVNKLTLAQQIQELESTAPELLKEPVNKKRVGLKPWASAEKGKVVMRIAPSPSGPLHIGHSYIVSLNSEYCRMYNGKFIVRIEDTNPDKIYPKSYDMIKDETDWLTENNVFQSIIQSSRLGIYYDYCEKLIEGGGGYVCTCHPDQFKETVNAKTACPCRKLSKTKHLERYHDMFVKYEPGAAVVRMKSDIKHKNPAMRDFPLMRINETPHPLLKKQQRVWPLMNFSVAIDDHELGVTHAIRGKDHMDNERRQKLIFDFFKWSAPDHLYVGKINFEGIRLSASETMRLIKDGVYSGWDDIRLPFIAALRRRGYSAKAFKQYAIEVGVSQNDKTVTADEFFTHLNSINRDIIDKDANRYFFIPEPVEIHIQNAMEQTVSIALHPDYLKRGKRRFVTQTVFYITQEDFDSINSNTVYRLMDCLNFEKKDNTFHFHSTEYEQYKAKGDKIMHWLPKNDNAVKTQVLMPNNIYRVGWAEQTIRKLMVGNIIQFERFGFCRLDNIEKDKYTFWFLHK